MGNGLNNVFEPMNIRDGIETAWLRELGESSIAADELLGEPGARSALAEAREFIYSTLSNGPVLATQLVRLARESGIAERTLERARAQLFREGVIARNKEGGGPWAWQLRHKPSIGEVGEVGGDTPKNDNTANTANNTYIGELGEVHIEELTPDCRGRSLEDAVLHAERRRQGS